VISIYDKCTSPFDLIRNTVLFLEATLNGPKNLVVLASHLVCGRCWNLISRYKQNERETRETKSSHSRPCLDQRHYPTFIVLVPVPLAPSIRPRLEQRKSVGIVEDMIPIGKIHIVLFGTKE
jgi:hypothetical protein